MKLFYWHDVPNFGDMLNPILWPKIFPNTFDDNNDELFLGIGSIIWQGYPQDSVKHVFGSGCGYRSIPFIDKNWIFHFVRGPKTALALGLSPSLAITDPAILLKKYYQNKKIKKHKVSFIPHWSAIIHRSYYKETCSKLGVNFISPLDKPDFIIDEILSSKLLFAEALHGAVVADTFRIPWIPVNMHGINHFKWIDWCNSMGVSYTPISFLSLGIYNLPKKIIKRIKLFDVIYTSYYLKHCLQSTKFLLSNDNNLNNSLERIEQKVEEFKHK